MLPPLSHSLYSMRASNSILENVTMVFEGIPFTDPLSYGTALEKNYEIAVSLNTRVTNMKKFMREI